MPRRPRIDVQHGLYYVVLRGHGAQPILFDAADLETFRELLAASLTRTRSSLHAFCLLLHRAELAIQVSNLPVSRPVHYLTSQYARWMHRKRGRSGQIFARHRAILVDPTQYLVELVRHIHRAPLRAALVDDLAGYPWTSHAAYLGEANLPWLTTHAALNMLDADSATAPETYRHFVQRDPDRTVLELLERGHLGDSRVVGDDAFLASLRAVSGDARDGSFATLIDTVAAQQNVSVQEILSPSRRRRAVLARALIAWHATRLGIATLTEAAEHLRRTPSTLWSAIARYRVRHANLFAEIVPLASDDA